MGEKSPIFKSTEMKDKKKKDKKKKKSKDKKKKKHSSIVYEPQIEKQESFFESLWRKFQAWLRT